MFGAILVASCDSSRANHELLVIFSGLDGRVYVPCCTGEIAYTKCSSLVVFFCLRMCL